MFKKNKNAKLSALITIVVIIFLIFLTLNVINEDVKIESQTIKASGLFGFTLKTHNIENIRLIDNLDIVMKLNGAGIGNTHKGLYKVKEYGNVKLYINNDKIKYNILITTKDNNYYIINLKTKEDTENLYKELSNITK